MAQLKDEDFFVTLDPEANSVAILVKHLAGNMRSRFTDFLTSDGEKADRQRDREFEITSSTTRADVLQWWEEGWNRVFSAIDPLKPEDVMRVVTIRTSLTPCFKPLIARSRTIHSTLDRLSCWQSISDRTSGRP